MTRHSTAADNSAEARISSVNSVLRAQLEALGRIEAILSNERAALESRDPDELLAAADAKSAALTRLGDLENQRKSISEDMHPDQVEKLRQLTARCRDLNQQNAALLNSQQQHVDRLLSLLRGTADSRTESYDASGRTSGKAAKQLKLTQA